MRRMYLAAVAAATAGLMAAGSAFAANQIVFGLNNVNSGPLKSPGEGTELAVDIAVAELNKAGGINGMQIKIVKFDTGSDLAIDGGYTAA